MRILVIGAGPAGAAAAIELARGGARVTIAERSAWPRAKTCGDGLSPPAVREARALGVDLGDRLPLPQGEISTPAGVTFRGGWRDETPWGTIVARADFDARLVASAVAAGAAFEPKTKIVALEPSVAGPVATIVSNGGEVRERFDATILGEGATGGLARSLGFARHASRLVALRGYVRSSRPLDPVFGLYFERPLSPGYGWVFPLDAGTANVGVLVDERFVRRRGGDLRGAFADWLGRSAAVARTLGARPTLADVEALSGGIVPTGRARPARHGVFLVGDAAGVADPFSAEGIFQAMGSGRAAARALVAHGPGRAAERAFLRALRPFEASAREARRLRLGFDFVIDAMARRAVERPRLARHFSANGFFMKESLPQFLLGIARNW